MSTTVRKLVPKGEARSVVAEREKTMEADGYSADEKVHSTAKAAADGAETPKVSTPFDSKVTQDRHGLDEKTLIGIYRTMYLSRRVDDKEIQLKGQNKIYFQISGAGHEAVLVAAALAMKPAYDWFFPYYRDRALMLALGMTAQEMLYSAVGAEVDPNSHGRQMPSHWGHKDLNVPSQSSCTGTQALHAVGAAEASYRASLVKESATKLPDSRATRSSICRSATARRARASGGKLSTPPVISSCRLSSASRTMATRSALPVEVGTAGGDISKLISGFPNLFVQKVDGTDPLASYAAFKKAVERCRKRKGPAFIHAKVIRPYSHSLSDDEKLYRPDEERERDAAIDPIKTYAEFLMNEGIASSEQLEALRKEVDAEINKAADIAIETPQPAPETALRNVFSPDVDPTDRNFIRHRGRRRVERQRRHDGRSHQPLHARRDGTRPAHRRLWRGRGRLFA